MLSSTDIIMCFLHIVSKAYSAEPKQLSALASTQFSLLTQDISALNEQKYPKELCLITFAVSELFTMARDPDAADRGFMDQVFVSKLSNFFATSASSGANDIATNVTDVAAEDQIIGLIPFHHENYTQVVVFSRTIEKGTMISC